MSSNGISCTFKVCNFKWHIQVSGPLLRFRGVQTSSTWENRSSRQTKDKNFAFDKSVICDHRLGSSQLGEQRAGMARTKCLQPSFVLAITFVVLVTADTSVRPDLQGAGQGKTFYPRQTALQSHRAV